MNSGSNPHSIRPREPLDGATLRVLRAVHAVSAALRCPFFVTGATARDLILVNVHGLRPGRATRDIDLGIAVESWEAFQTLKTQLVATRQFVASRSAQQRLTYTDPALGFSLPIDLIPFGGITSAGQMIEWPPDRDVVVTVAGFDEAWASSLSIEVETDFIVQVASVPGLTLLKLIAWADRHIENNKDASDLHRLFTTYADAGNIDRLYDQELALLEAADFNLELAGATLLGRDVAGIASSATEARVRALLTSPRLLDRLIGQMVQTSTDAESEHAATGLVRAFSRGFLT